jgi:hypothetical protein
VLKAEQHTTRFFVLSALKLISGKEVEEWGFIILGYRDYFTWLTRASMRETEREE